MVMTGISDLFSHFMSLVNIEHYDKTESDLKYLHDLEMNVESDGRLYIVDTVQDSLTLTCSDDNPSVDDTITLTATLKDEENKGIGHISIGFYEGNTLLGKSITNNNGVASLSYTFDDDGLHTFTSSTRKKTSNTLEIEIAEIPLNQMDLTLNVSENILSHYDEDTTTLTATLTRNNNGVSGKTVSFYNGNTLLGTGVTDSSGEANCIYESNGCGEITLRAEYMKNNNSIEDTVNVIDACFYRSGVINPIFELNNITTIPVNFKATLKITETSTVSAGRTVGIGSRYDESISFGVGGGNSTLYISVHYNHSVISRADQDNVFQKNVETETVYTYVDGVQTITANDVTLTVNDSSNTARNYLYIGNRFCIVKDLMITPITE